MTERLASGIVVALVTILATTGGAWWAIKLWRTLAHFAMVLRQRETRATNWTEGPGGEFRMATEHPIVGWTAPEHTPPPFQASMVEKIEPTSAEEGCP